MLPLMLNSKASLHLPRQMRSRSCRMRQQRSLRKPPKKCRKSSPRQLRRRGRPLSPRRRWLSRRSPRCLPAYSLRSQRRRLREKNRKRCGKSRPPRILRTSLSSYLASLSCLRKRCLPSSTEAEASPSLWTTHQGRRLSTTLSCRPDRSPPRDRWIGRRRWCPCPQPSSRRRTPGGTRS